jgi:hypothetical protein
MYKSKPRELVGGQCNFAIKNRGVKKKKKKKKKNEKRKRE